MPKFLDNYKLQSIQNYITDGMEHFIGKQIGSNKNFILKRFKPDSLTNSQQISSKYPASSTQQLFHKLTHETIILKGFSNPAIPKCIRMLKTSNSIYFVWENYPLMSLQQFLEKTWMKMEQKIQLSIKILQILEYIHQKNVAYKGLNLQSVKIDSNRNPYFLNFKNAVLIEKNQSDKKSEDQMKINTQFNNLIIEDNINAIKLLYEIFQFKKINPKFYVFSSIIQRKVYEYVAQVLQKNLSILSLDHLKEILCEKRKTHQTECTTETHDSIPSPTTIKRSSKKTQLSRDFDFQKSKQSVRNSVSCSKITLRGALQRAQLLRSQKTMVRQNKNELSNTVVSLASSRNQLKTNNNKYIVQKQSDISTNQLINIALQRKVLNLLLHCLKCIDISNNLQITYLFGLKCQQYTNKIQKQIQESSSKHLSSKQMEFLKIINNQNLKTQNFVGLLKDSIKQIAKQNFYNQSGNYANFQEAFRRGKTSFIEENLASQIYKYLQKQLCTFSSNEESQSPALSSFKQGNQTVKQNKKMSSLKVKRTISLIVLKSAIQQEMNYNKFKFYYYLTIKLKYGTYEKFFERKHNHQAEKYNVLQDEYFLPFQTRSIPVDQLVQEILFRMEKFTKKSQSLNSP